MMQCPKCQKEVPEGNTFCSQCGAIISSSNEPVVKVENSKMAITAMVLGILGLVTLCVGIGVLFGITGLVLGIMSFMKIHKSHGKITGEGYAIAGIVTGGVIVVMLPIIGILAAIAIPNFLQAQVRAKVSRAKAEQQSLATALESYYIDNNRYPLPDYDAQGKSIIPHVLTTPVAYISSLWKDPFSNSSTGYYGYGVHNKSSDDTTEGWVVTSLGPDNVDGYTGQPFPHSKAWSDEALGFPLYTSGLTYDPSNGTTSAGDIWRRGP